MIKSPADSLVYKGTNTQVIEDAILKHYISTDRATDPSSQLELVSKGDSPFKVYRLVAGREIEPKPFVIPLRFVYQDEHFIVFDARPSTRIDTRTRMTVITNPGLYNRELIRSFLQGLWQDEGPNAILRLGNLQIKVFATWLSNVISSQFGLDAEQALALTIYCAYYYLTLFVEPGRLDMARTARIISASLNIAEHVVNSVLSNAESLNQVADISGFLEVLPSILVTERLSGLTLDLFIAKLSGSWFGPNNALLIGIALEYPPMFVTLMYLGLTDRSTKLARLATVALRFERDKLATEFLRSIEDILTSELQNFKVR